jgi:hypothetical protein
MSAALHEIGRAVAARRGLWAAITLAIFAGYYLALLAATMLRFGSWPNYARLHDLAGGIRLIFAGTAHWGDILDLLAEEILLEVGYLHPTFGLAEWSVNFIPVRALLVLALAALAATFAVLTRCPPGTACAARSGKGAGAAAGLGGVLIALSSATLTWVVCCSTPSWVVGLAMMGLGVSASLALEPLGTWIAAAGLLLLAAGVLLQARRRARVAADRLVGAHA